MIASHSKEQWQSFISTHRDPIHPYNRPYKRRVGQDILFRWGKVHSFAKSRVSWRASHLPTNLAGGILQAYPLFSPYAVAVPSSEQPSRAERFFNAEPRD